MLVNSSRIDMSGGVEWAVMQYINDYQSGVIEALDHAIPDVAKEGVKKLKAVSPTRYGKYKKGWAYKTDRGRLKKGATIYGKHGTYQLAHLLEYGHAQRGGGRVAAREHIAGVDQWINDEVINRIIEEIERRTR